MYMSLILDVRAAIRGQEGVVQVGLEKGAVLITLNEQVHDVRAKVMDRLRSSGLQDSVHIAFVGDKAHTDPTITAMIESLPDTDSSASDTAEMSTVGTDEMDVVNPGDKPAA